MSVTTRSGPTPFYITTAIDYPNAPPHIGHSLEKVAADVVARYHRLIGDDTAYTMGLDENSQHVLRAAIQNGVTPVEWTDDMDVAFRRAWDALDVSRTAWVRTTEERHFRASQELFRRAQANGDIYTATYAGWYCPNCNNYYIDEELVDGRCPNHPTIEPDWLEEENYFFALSNHQERLRRHIEEHPEFITPSVWRPEMLALIDRGLRDFSVSRAVRPGTTPWGVPVPGDPNHVLYVWFDALTTYLTAIGFPDDTETSARYWPADSQVIGKDIQRFHCLYWPAMLLSSGLPLPRRVIVHGFITVEGQRISKTTGNVIDPVKLVEEFGVDPVRYYLMRDITFRSDGDFSRANLIRRHNDDLGNDLGNLLNRVVAMVGRYRDGRVPEPGEPGEPEVDLRRVAEEARDRAAEQIEAWELDRALESLWTLVRRANQYLEARQPWKLAKQPEAAQTLETTLWTAAEATRLVAIFLAPYVPATSDKIVHQLGLEPIKAGAWANAGQWGAATFGAVNLAGPIFPRIEVATV
ncbi:MAG: methionine--tRNA ligase [Thermomicrobiales bacterium]